MARCFISYCSADVEFAERVEKILSSYHVDVFMAKTSLSPGERWGERILDELEESSHLIFLASARSCRSAYVQQELGGAILRDKTVIPVVWDMDPTELPGWARDYHAVDLRDLDEKDVDARLEEMANELPGDSAWPFAVLAGGVTLAWLLFSRRTASIGRSGAGDPVEGESSCPNCSSGSEAVLMSPIPQDFQELELATHECPNCGLKIDTREALAG